MAPQEAWALWESLSMGECWRIHSCAGVYSFSVCSSMQWPCHVISGCQRFMTLLCSWICCTPTSEMLLGPLGMYDKCVPFTAKCPRVTFANIFTICETLINCCLLYKELLCPRLKKGESIAINEDVGGSLASGKITVVCFSPWIYDLHAPFSPGL